MSICKNCGQVNADDQAFCEVCGAVLDQNENLEQILNTYPDETINRQNSGEYNDYNDYKTVCLLAMILGIVSFFINPLYLVSIAAIVLGIIGHVKSFAYKNWAIAGWICGGAGLIVQIFVDIFCTFGLGIFC